MSNEKLTPEEIQGLTDEMEYTFKSEGFVSFYGKEAQYLLSLIQKDQQPAMSAEEFRDNWKKGMRVNDRRLDELSMMEAYAQHKTAGLEAEINRIKPFAESAPIFKSQLSQLREEKEKLESQLKAEMEEMENIKRTAGALIFLHSCEEEGMASGQPKPSQWRKAVSELVEAINPTEHQ